MSDRFAALFALVESMSPQMRAEWLAQLMEMDAALHELARAALAPLLEDPGG